MKPQFIQDKLQGHVPQVLIDVIQAQERQNADLHSKIADLVQLLMIHASVVKDLNAAVAWAVGSPENLKRLQQAADMGDKIAALEKKYEQSSPLTAEDPNQEFELTARTEGN